MSNHNLLGADLGQQVLRAMDSLFNYCHKHLVTDLHFEPGAAYPGLRCRIGTDLINYTELNSQLITPMMQRFKILAHMDISERTLPQDAQFIWYDQHQQNPIPCRISTCPTLYGEKMVIRLLSLLQLKQDWTTLGMSASQKDLIQKSIAYDDGMILICGATGSGKTTTLYSLLSYLNHGCQNIVSIEDPIEIPFLGFTQIELMPHLGFGISECLRTVLRQDPDIIMIGEIRDKQTALLTLQAAQTGHLMLSTLHAKTPLGCIQRFTHLGVSPMDLLEHLRLIVYQKRNKWTVEFELLEITPKLKNQLITQHGQH
jgi:type II secretory ATPase GspE/PulE/Tfp pilus assembly ATPase PilB-like protein